MRYKKDIIFLSVLALILFALYLIFNLYLKSSADYVVITVDGDSFGEAISLNEDAQIPINTKFGHNELIIKNGKAHMESASCPDKICEKQGEIDSTGETITCLPNRVFVRAVSGNEEVDALVK